MTMQKNKGHCATTRQSKASENLHREIVTRSCEDRGFILKRDLSFSEIVGDGNVKHAFRKTGQVCKILSDGGCIIDPITYEILGVLENKHQQHTANACERVFKYLALVGSGKIFRAARQIFVSFTGDAFIDGNGGQGLATLELTKYVGITHTVNANAQNLQSAVNEYLDFIESIR